MKNLYIITILYFILGIININFALLGFVCMIVPFTMLFITKKKKWCQKYCPRSYLFTKVCPSGGKKTPKFLATGSGKWYMLAYFCISLGNIIFNMAQVISKNIEPNGRISLFMFIKLPFKLPQILNFSFIHENVEFLSYSLYSMMLSMTIIGIVLGFLYKPKTFCTICPVGTLSNEYVKMHKKK